MEEFLKWFIPLIVGVVVSPLINRVATKPTPSDTKAKEAQTAEDFTSAAKQSIDIMQITMKSLEKSGKETTKQLRDVKTQSSRDIRMLTRKVGKLQDDLKKESASRKECQRVLSKLAAKNNITMPRSKV